LYAVLIAIHPQFLPLSSFFYVALAFMPASSICAAAQRALADLSSLAKLNLFALFRPSPNQKQYHTAFFPLKYSAPFAETRRLRYL